MNMSDLAWDSPRGAETYDRKSDHQFLTGTTLIEMMEIKKGDSVLDVGCGTGRQAVNVLRRIGPEGNFIGIDPSPYCVDLARKKVGGNSVINSRFLVGHAADLSAACDNSIDHAYFASSFHWVDDKKTALDEVHRVLRPGGKLGMTTLDRDSQNTMRTLVDPIYAKHHIERKHEWYRRMKRVTASELHNLLSTACFASISIESRSILRRYDSPEEFLEHLEQRDGPDGLFHDKPDEIREKIRQEITEEFRKTQTPTPVGFGNPTLFAIATKPE
jgi:ubiquinone/menaquinone biosynthesis C-methylase UbiE